MVAREYGHEATDKPASYPRHTRFPIANVCGLVSPNVEAAGGGAAGRRGLEVVAFVQPGADPCEIRCRGVTSFDPRVRLRGTSPKVKSTRDVGQFQVDDALECLDERHNLFKPFEDGGCLLDAEHQPHFFSAPRLFDWCEGEMVVGAELVGGGVRVRASGVGNAAAAAAAADPHTRHVILLTQKPGCGQRVAEQLLKIHLHDVLEVAAGLEGLVVVGVDVALDEIGVWQRVMVLLFVAATHGRAGGGG